MLKKTVAQTNRDNEKGKGTEITKRKRGGRQLLKLLPRKVCVKFQTIQDLQMLLKLCKSIVKLNLHPNPATKTKMMTMRRCIYLEDELAETTVERMFAKVGFNGWCARGYYDCACCEGATLNFWMFRP